MSIALLGRPAPLSWSRNAFAILYYFSYPTAGSRLYVQLQDASTLTTITEVSYPFTPTLLTGTLTPRLEKLIDPLLTWQRPARLTPGSGAQIIDECVNNIQRFKVRWRFAPPSGAIVWTQDTATQAVIKGGIGDMTYTGEDDVNSAGTMVLPRSSRFLTWIPNERLQAADEWGWLLYLSLVTDLQQVEYSVKYADGSAASFIRAFNTGAGSMQFRNFFIPTGVQQAGLDPGKKGVVSVTIIVQKFSAMSGSWTTVDSYPIRVDNRIDYRAFTLYYRNSLGGWDNIRLRGEQEWSADAERKEAGDPSRQRGSNPFYDVSMRPKWKLSTGYMSREHLTALNDLLLSTDCALLQGEQWLPVRVTSKNLTPYSTKDNLHSTIVEIEAAGSFSSYPRQYPTLK